MRTYTVRRIQTPAKEQGGPLRFIRRGKFKINLGPQKKLHKGVPEVLAMVARESGQFEIELEEPETAAQEEGAGDGEGE